MASSKRKFPFNKFKKRIKCYENNLSDSITEESSDSSHEFSHFVQPNILFNNTIKKFYSTPSNCSFQQWYLYFPSDKYHDSHKFIPILNSLIKYYELECFVDQKWVANYLNSEFTFISVDFQSLMRSKILNDNSSDFYKLFFHYFSSENNLQSPNPELNMISSGQLLNMFALAISYLVRKNSSSEDFEQLKRSSDFQIVAHIINHSPFTRISTLRSIHLDKFISIQGIVVRVSAVQRTCTQMCFQCRSCGKRDIWCLPSDGAYVSPTSCSNKDCRSKSFEPLLDDIYTKTTDQQLITVQESQDDLSSETLSSSKNSGASRKIDCILYREMVDKCLPGDVIQLSGILSLTKSQKFDRYSSFRYQSKDSNLYDMTIFVNSLVISNAKISNVTKCDSGLALAIRNVPRYLDSNFRVVSEASPLAVPCLHTSFDIYDDSQANFFSSSSLGANIFSEDPDFTVRDLQNIQNLSECPKLFELLTDSFCSEIFGHKNIKQGILLTLLTIGLSSNQEELNTNRKEAVVLDSIEVKRRHVSHILILGDPGLGKSQMLRQAVTIAPRAIYVCGSSTSAAGLTVGTVRAGGLNGDNQQQGFNMEAGALVLADQGVCCIDEFDKLSCNPTVLLEAMEQQTVSIARGTMVCNLPARASVIAVANPSSGKYDFSRRLDENVKISDALLSRFDLIFVMNDIHNDENDKRVTEHMLKRNSKDYGGINSSLLKKYLLYARKYVSPELSLEARNVLREFYIDWRKESCCQDIAPVTVRQLEALVRLSKARARAELREIVVASDAEFVCVLLKEASKINHPILSLSSELQSQCSRRNGKSVATLARRFLTAIELISKRSQKRTFTLSEMDKIAANIQLNFQNFNLSDLIDKLNSQGALLKQNSNTYKLVL